MRLACVADAHATAAADGFGIEFAAASGAPRPVPGECVVVDHTDSLTPNALRVLTSSTAVGAEIVHCGDGGSAALHPIGRTLQNVQGNEEVDTAAMAMKDSAEEAVRMAEVRKNSSSLQQRIAAGTADPISDREREQLEEMRQVFIRRFGYDPTARHVSDRS